MKILLSRYDCGYFNYSDYDWDMHKMEIIENSKHKRKRYQTNYMKTFPEQGIMVFANNNNELTLLNFDKRDDFSQVNNNNELDVEKDNETLENGEYYHHHNIQINSTTEVKISHLFSFSFNFAKTNSIIDIDIIEFNNKKCIALAFENNNIFIMRSKSNKPDYLIPSNSIGDEILSVKFIVDNSLSSDNLPLLYLSCMTLNGNIKFFSIPYESAYDKFYICDSTSNDLSFSKKDSFEFRNIGTFLSLINSDAIENSNLENIEDCPKTNSMIKEEYYEKNDDNMKSSITQDYIDKNSQENDKIMNFKSDPNQCQDNTEDDEEDEIINKLINLNKSMNSNENCNNSNSSNNSSNNLNIENKEKIIVNLISKEEELQSSKMENNKENINVDSLFTNSSTKLENNFQEEVYNELFTNSLDIFKMKEYKKYEDEEIIKCDDLFGWYDDLIIQNNLKSIYSDANWGTSVIKTNKNSSNAFYNRNNYDFNIFS